MSHAAWPEESTQALLLSEFDERFRRYRLSVPEAERGLVDSLKRYGQMAPVVVCVSDGEFLLIERAAASRLKPSISRNSPSQTQTTTGAI